MQSEEKREGGTAEETSAETNVTTTDTDQVMSYCSISSRQYFPNLILAPGPGKGEFYAGVY